MYNIRLRVANLVRKYDTCDPYRLAKALKIDVYALELPKSIRGFFIRPLKRRVIVLNSTMSEHERLVALCHELGHVRLHKGYGMLMRKYIRNSKQEAEANEFALHLLSYSRDIDAASLKPILDQRRPDALFVHNLLTALAEQ